MYNIENQKYTRVTNTSQFESETDPSIYEDNIAYGYLYYDKVNGTLFYSLKMYNITTEDETTIVTGEEPTGSTPEIFGKMTSRLIPAVNITPEGGSGGHARLFLYIDFGSDTGLSGPVAPFENTKLPR
jgi:hypothetical protein